MIQKLISNFLPQTLFLPWGDSLFSIWESFQRLSLWVRPFLFIIPSMLYFYKNSCSCVCWILLPYQSYCAFFYTGSSILSFDLAILFPKRDTQCTHAQGPLKIFQHLPNGTAASCSMDVTHSLYLFEDFEVPFRLFFIMSISFGPNFLSV